MPCLCWVLVWMPIAILLETLSTAFVQDAGKIHSFALNNKSRAHRQMPLLFLMSVVTLALYPSALHQLIGYYTSLPQLPVLTQVPSP